MRFVANDASGTRAFAEQLGKTLHAGDLLLLVGDLGSGKTTFTQGLAAGLGVEGNVTSPTYIIARVHDPLEDGPGLVHVDAYRLEDDLDLETIDLDATVEEGVTVVEWGRGRAEGLQEERLEVEFDFDQDNEDLRTITLHPIGPQWQERLAVWQEQFEAGSES